MSERVDYTHPIVLDPETPWAGPADPFDPAYDGRLQGYDREPDTGRPIIPYAEAGIDVPPDMPRGRGVLGWWGPNYAAVGIVLRRTSSDYSVLLAERTDTEQESLPGGFENPGEKPVQASTREVREETGINLQGVPHAAFEQSYADDRRNTINAAIVDRPVVSIVHFAPDPTPDGTEISRARWAPLKDVYGLHASHDKLLDKVRERLDAFKGLMDEAQDLHGAGEFARAEEKYNEAKNLLPDPLERGRAMRGAVASASRQPEPQDAPARRAHLSSLTGRAQAALDEQEKVFGYTPRGIYHVERDIAQSKTVRGSTGAHEAVIHELDGLSDRGRAQMLGRTSLGWLRQAYNNLAYCENQPDNPNRSPDQHRINLISRLAVAEALYGDKREARKFAQEARRAAPLSERPDNPTSADLSPAAQKRAQRRARARAYVASLVAWMPGVNKDTVTRKLALKLAATKAGF